MTETEQYNIRSYNCSSKSAAPRSFLNRCGINGNPNKLCEFLYQFIGNDEVGEPWGYVFFEVSDTYIMLNKALGNAACFHDEGRGHYTTVTLGAVGEDSEPLAPSLRGFKRLGESQEFSNNVNERFLEMFSGCGKAELIAEKRHQVYGVWRCQFRLTDVPGAPGEYVLEYEYQWCA